MPSPTRDTNEVKNVLKSLGVKTYMDGQLAVMKVQDNEIEITRGHSYYWIADGLVPLQKALKLYANPIGRDMIRVNGNCGCPAPDGIQVVWIAPDGKKVISVENRARCEQYVLDGREAADKGEEPGMMADIGADILRDHHFSDNPALDFDAKGYVEAYHIDSDEALKIFVEELKKP